MKDKIVLMIAMLAHAINVAYCRAMGDNTQVEWQDSPEWQRQSAINGVKMHLSNPDATPEQSHESWLRQKEEEGWVYGKEKNAEAKEHPCMMPFDELPIEQRAKDHLFRAAVHSAKALIDSMPTKTVAVVDGVKAQLGKVLVKYIGRREVWTDAVYHSGLTFASGQVRALPADLARKLLRHEDLFVLHEDNTTSDSAEPDQKGDNTQDLMDEAAVKAKKDDRSQEFAVIDQVNRMEKDDLVQYAAANRDMKLNKNKKIENMRAEVVEHINRFGV